VEDLRDPDLWDDAVEKERQMRAELRTFVNTYRSNGKDA